MRDKENEIFLNNKSYIPVGRAADLTGYHGDYIGRLCREKKIDGIKIGNNWLVFQEDILNLASKNGSKTKNGKNIAFPTSKISIIDKNHDEWDKALFNDFPVERPSVNKNTIASPTFKALKQKTIVFCLIFILLVFFYKYPESVSAGFRDFRKFSNQVFTQTAQLTPYVYRNTVIHYFFTYFIYVSNKCSFFNYFSFWFLR